MPFFWLSTFISARLENNSKSVTYCDAIQVKPYDRNMIPRFTHFTILVKVPKHFL